MATLHFAIGPGPNATQTTPERSTVRCGNMSSRVIGPFTIRSQLGVGGMGVVYEATWIETGKRVALKVLSPEFSLDHKLLARFEREIAILRKLKHANIVRCFGGGTHEQQRYLVMEYIDGGSLQDLLERKGRLSWEQVVNIGRQVCSGLEHAHRAGIIHRDLKPANLFLTKGGRLKIGDFGIARDEESTALTAAGKTVGTYAYMSPEQIVGKPRVSGKTDLYALGCLMFELLASRKVFEADQATQMLFKHVEEVPRSVREFDMNCPIWLDDIIRRLLEKDPDDRPYDALAVHTELTDIEHKVASHTSAVEQMVSERATTIVSERDRTEIKRALSRKRGKKRRKREYVAWYEQTWVLLTALAVLIGIATWSLWPLNEEQLFERARSLMAMDDRTSWRSAREKFVEPYLDHFPDGRYVTEMTGFIDRIDMDREERRAMKRAEKGREPESEAERLFVDALEYERYRSLVELLEDRPDDRPFVNLARRQIRTIEQSGDGTRERMNVVNDALREANQLFRGGKVVEADRKWRSVVTLYQGNREFNPQTRYAQARLDRRDVPRFDFGEPDRRPDEPPGS